MNRHELSHRYRGHRNLVGEGIFSKIASKVVSAVTSDVGKKMIKKTVDSAIDTGAKKAGEFIVEQITKRPGELIQEHFATVRKPPLDDEEEYLQSVIDRILKM